MNKIIMLGWEYIFNEFACFTSSGLLATRANDGYLNHCDNQIVQINIDNAITAPLGAPNTDSLIYNHVLC